MLRLRARTHVRLGLFAVALALLVYPAAVSAAGPSATVTVNPSSGPAGQAITATYQVYGPNNCPQGTFTVQFRWDGFPGQNATGSEGQGLGSAPLDTAQCVATLQGVAPPPGATVGSHQVWAFIDNGQGSPVASVTVTEQPASYAIQIVPTSQTTKPPTVTTTSQQTTSTSAATTTVPTSPTAPTTVGGPPTTPPPILGGTPDVPAGSAGALPALRARSLGHVATPMPADFGERVPWAVAGGLLLGVVTIFGVALVSPPLGVSRWVLAVPLVIAAASLPVVGGGLIDRPTVKLHVDNIRVTHGLDWDVDDGAGVAYDLIAGKDVLVRTVLSAADPPEEATLASASCHVLRVTSVSYDGSGVPTGTTADETVPAIVTPVESFKTSGGATSVLGTAKRWRVDCWVQGYQVSPPGDYQFRLDARVAGQKTQTLDLGTRTFLPTGDFRLYIYPWVLPDNGVTRSEGFPWEYCGKIPPATYKTDCPKMDTRKIYYPWTSKLLPTFFGAMDEFQRMMPVRSGAGSFDWTGAKPHTSGTPGLRYSFGPIVDCTDDWPTDPQGMRTVETGCDGRAAAELAAAAQNAKLDKLDAADGRHRDRFDQHLLLGPLRPGLPGGGQCRGGHLMGAAIDEDNPKGWDGYLWTHELGHCLGQVLPGDPHACSVDPACTKLHGADAGHVKSRPGGGNKIPLYAGLPMANTLTRTDDPSPQSVMGWDTDWGPGASNFYFEGWEWNALRSTLLTKPRPDPVNVTYRVVSSKSDVPRFVVLGSISGDSVTVTRSQRTEDQLAPTPSVADGAFELVFIDSAGQTVDRLPFGPSALIAPGGSDTTAPDSYRGNSFMLARPIPDGATRAEIRHGDTRLFTQALTGAPPPLGAVNASTTGDGSSIDASWTSDSAAVSYNVWLDLGPGLPPTLAAVGLRSQHVTLPTMLLPATGHARVIVESSDGFNTSRATSNEFTIRDRPPTVTILAPTRDDSMLFAQRSVTLTGAAYDSTAGTLDGRALTWRSDRAGVLGHGAHLVAVLAPGEQTITLEATASSGQHAVSSVRVIVHPASAAPPVTLREPSRPTAFRLTSNHVDLGDCAKGSTNAITVQTLTPGTTETAASDSHWLGVEGPTPNGTVRLRADCRGLSDGVRYTAQVLVSAGPGQSEIVSVTLGHGDGTGHREAGFLALILVGTWAAMSSAGHAIRSSWRRVSRRRGTP